MVSDWVLEAALQEREIRAAVGLEASGDLAVEGVATLSRPRDRSLHFAGADLETTALEGLAQRDGCVLLAPTGSGYADALPGWVVIEVANPRAAMAKVLSFIRAEGRVLPWTREGSIAPDADVSPLSVVAANVDVGSGVVVEPFCTIGPDVAIGARTVIRSGVRITGRVRIGEDCVVDWNSVIGTQGYGFVRDEDGNKVRVPQLGGVLIGSHVEIGALSLLQHGTIEPTVLSDHVKMGDMSGVGHNSHIARNVSMVGRTSIGGQCFVDEDAWIGIGATLRSGKSVGKGALVGMDASVQRDVPAGHVAMTHGAKVLAREVQDPTAIGFG